MTTPEFEQNPDKREALGPQLSIDSRFPKLAMPEQSLWPTRIHDDAVKAVAEETLPILIDTLSTPIAPATNAQLVAIFGKNPHDRKLSWSSRREAGITTYSTGAYEGVTDAKGSTPLFDGINYAFDENGRLIQREYIEGERSYDRGRPRFQEFFTYDEDGYLTERTQWAKYDSTFTDKFDYEGEGKDKTPTTMTRVVKVRSDYTETDGEPMTVDLANYEQWLTENPNGIKAVTAEELQPKELVVGDFEVTESRRGIHFAHPEQVEHALYMYGSGDYPMLEGETALEYNVKAFSESAGNDMAGAMLGMFAMRGDMGEFVKERITDDVQAKWKSVQKARRPDASENVRFSFDYDGAGHFHKTSGDVAVDKDGLVLNLSAAYVGDKVEDTLAVALGKKRGLRGAAVTLPINQTDKEGYFYVDLKEVCQKLGAEVTDDQIDAYLADYLDEGLNEEEKRKATWGGVNKAPLFSDEANGVSINLRTQGRDYETDTDLQAMFGRTKTAIWGPMPKRVRSNSDEDVSRDIPKVVVAVKPNGNPFDDETTSKSDAVVKSYMDRLKTS